MIKVIILIALLCGVVTGNTNYPRNYPRTFENARKAVIMADASEWIDQILANLRSEMNRLGLNNMPLPDFKSEFSKKILGITWHGEASLTQGFLAGLESIHRTGVADITTDTNGDMIITVEGGVTSGSLGYDALVQFMNLGPTASVTGTIKKISVELTIRVGANLHANLDKLDIKHLGVLSVDVDGLGFTGILDFIAEILIDGVGNVVKGVVGEFLQGTLKNVLNKIIQDTLYPGSQPQAFYPGARALPMKPVYNH